MNMNEEVTAWLAAYDNPMKPVVEEMRRVILSADARVGECIKWRAPTFVYKGNIASFFPRSKKHASLMFHTGASIPGAWRYLEGDAKEGRSMKVASLDELEVKRAELAEIVRAWCDLQDAG